MPALADPLQSMAATARPFTEVFPGMTDRCELRAANGQDGVACTGAECMYWRLADHIGAADGVEWEGCAIQHFRMLEGGADVAAWLLSVKDRIESSQ
jgi:hypothetical protein